MTNRDRVLSTLRHATSPLDDDELAQRAEVSPRQQVNQICRALVRDGLIARVSGPDGKIVNLFLDVDDPQTTGLEAIGGAAAPEPTSAPPLPPGDSAEQRRAERAMLDALGERLGLVLNPRRLERPGGIRVEIDGADDDLTVLVECWAHQGPAKVAQKYKLVNDAVKLHWIGSSASSTPPRRIICVTDAAAVQHLQGRSWQAQAIRDLGVEIEVVELPEPMRAAVAAAQARQFR